MYLRASINTIVKRLKTGKNSRPLVAELDEDKLSEYVAKHLFERRNFYEQAGNTIDVDKNSVEELAVEIQNLF